MIFNNTSEDFVLISADVLLKMIEKVYWILQKMTTILKELKIAQLRSKNKRTFYRHTFFQNLRFCVRHRVFLQKILSNEFQRKFKANAIRLRILQKGYPKVASMDLQWGKTVYEVFTPPKKPGNPYPKILKISEFLCCYYLPQ